jgi:predicted nucleic acid-binding protein
MLMIFADTSALHGLLSQEDVYHEQLVAAWEALRAENAQLVTSNYVVVESVVLLHHRAGLATVDCFLEKMQPLLEVEWVTREDHDLAVQMLRLLRRRHLSLVDCTSFVVMKRLGINEAFTVDRHFAERGLICRPS